MNFYRSLFSFLILLNGSAAGAAVGIAWSCADEVEKPSELVFPRELHIKPEVVAFAAQSERDVTLLRALSRVLAVLDHPELKEIGPLLGGDGHPPIPGRAERSSFFSEYPEFLSATAAANYQSLQTFADAHGLNDFELGLLSSLFPGVKYNEIPADVVIKANSHWVEKINAKLLLALRQDRFRLAAFELLSKPSYFGFVLGAMNKALATYGRAVTPLALNGMIQRMGSGTMNEADKMFVYTIFTSLMDQVIGFGRANGLEPFIEDWKENYVYFERDEFLNLLERYYVERLDIESSLTDLTDLYDFVAFDKPLPLEAFVLRRMALDAAGRLLFPLRQRYAEARQRQATEAARLDARPVALLQLKLVEHFPAPAPSKKKREPKVEPTAPTVAEAPAETIPAALNLLNFTASVPRPQPLEKLDGDTLYRVQFRRGRGETARVRLGPKVVAWLQTHPREARQLIAALTRGRARFERENGIKIFYRVRPSDHRIYEIKTSSTIRGLMVLVDGVFQFVDVVYKDEVARAAENVAPL